MIVCSKCGDVLYTDTMPGGSDAVEYVLCISCANAKTMSITITQQVIAL